MDWTKPYCGNCGAQGVPLGRINVRVSDDPQHVCRDRKACEKRVADKRKGNRLCLD
jgi:hypothetical protein